MEIINNNFINLNKEKSFYVGDNYGLLSTINNTKKGFSDIDSSDIKFAKNINIDFYTSQEYFNNIDRPNEYLLDTYGIQKLKKYATFGTYQKKFFETNTFRICVGYWGTFFRQDTLY